MRLTMLFLLALAALMLLGCDSRGDSKPDITFDAQTYNVFHSSKNDAVPVWVTLTGSQSQIAQRRIDLVFNDDMAHMYNTGSGNTYTYTDDSGQADFGVLILQDYEPESYPYIVRVTAKMETYPSVSQTIYINVHKPATITGLNAESYTINTGGSTVINCQLGQTSLISGVKVDFTATLAGQQIDSRSLVTDSSGAISYTFNVGGTTGTCHLKAEVVDCDDVSQQIDIEIE